MANCTVSGNFAKSQGGGVMVWYSAITATNCRFLNNATNGTGGGIQIITSQERATLVNCLFLANQANNGGGLNTAAANEPATLINCTFAGNSAINVGGIFNSHKLTLTNSIIWGNTGGQIATSTNSTMTVTHTCVQGGYSGTGNISIDPRLLADGSLGSASPCIDAGNNTAVPSEITTDLAEQVRFVDDPFMPDSGNPGTPPRPEVDMGAYEHQAATPPISIHVKANAPPGGDGKSWATAYRHLQDALARPQAPLSTASRSA
jgi:hypothetical protein